MGGFKSKLALAALVLAIFVLIFGFGKLLALALISTLIIALAVLLTVFYLLICFKLASRRWFRESS